MRKKRVLLLSEGFGAGHTQAAHALARSLRLLAPDIQTRVLELGKFLHPMLAPWVFTAYRKTVSTQPRLYGMVYRSRYKKIAEPHDTARLAPHFFTHRRQPSSVSCVPIRSCVRTRSPARSFPV